MDEHEYIDALVKLKADRQVTLNRLRTLDMAIESITSLTTLGITGIGATVGTYKSVDVNLDKTKVEKKGTYDDYEVEILEEYNPDLSMPEMLIHALYKMHGATAHEAAEYIDNVDKSHGLEYLKRRFTDIASGLGRANKLDIKKKGKRFKYSIKEPNISVSLLDELDNELIVNLTK